MYIIYSQYKRIDATEKKLFGNSRTEIKRKILVSIGYGAVGGFAASIVLFLLGVSLTNIGVYFILPLALLLMLVKKRYLCFAYAGGLIALLASFLQLFPSLGSVLENTLLDGLLTLHVPGLLSLVAVLHFTESILIRYSGHIHRSPMFVKTPRGDVVGGFSMQAFWPLPLVGLALAAALQMEVTGDTLPMPDWWPLLGTDWSGFGSDEMVFLMLPLVAWLGYGDIAVSATPVEKAQRSSLALGAYSLVLLFLALAASQYAWLSFPAAIFSPLGHELVIFFGNKREFGGEYLYSPVDRGIRVLDTFPKTYASKILEPGDVILSVSGEEINNTQDFWQTLYKYHPFIYLEVLKPGGGVAKKRVSLPSGDMTKLGVILVPKNPTAYAEVKH